MIRMFVERNYLLLKGEHKFQVYEKNPKKDEK
jgi:hypothetical protein